MQFLGRTGSCRAFGFIHEWKTPAAGQAAVSLRVRALPAAKAHRPQGNSPTSASRGTAAGLHSPGLADRVASLAQCCLCCGTRSVPRTSQTYQLPGWLQAAGSDRGEAGASCRGSGRGGERVEDGAGNAYTGIIRPLHCEDFPPLLIPVPVLWMAGAVRVPSASPASFLDPPFPAAQPSSATAPGWVQFVFHDVRSDSS